MTTNDYDERIPSKLWTDIQTVMNRYAIVENRMETVEHAMDEHGRRNADINRKLELIYEKLEKILTNQTDQNLRIIQNTVEIQRLWAFPLKITGAIIAIGGASVFVWKFVEWLMSAQDITKIPR